ncbi:MAG: peptide-methionine (S)-S-oxide reductase MsrA [Bacteroidota bacterium]
MKKNLIAIVLGLFVLTASCGNSSSSNKSNYTKEDIVREVEYTGAIDTATFAGGCFWCTEAVFERVEGVVNVVSGYSGGTAENADYRKVSYGLTNHAECVQIYYDPGVISYKELVKIFFATHDPTQLNRQGPDVGEQYRSEVFYRTDKEKEIVQSHINKLQNSNTYEKAIVTKVSKLDSFYEAEEYHQDYYELNPYQGYILSVAKPKVKKFFKYFPEYVKEKYRKEKG